MGKCGDRGDGAGEHGAAGGLSGGGCEEGSGDGGLSNMGWGK